MLLSEVFSLQLLHNRRDTLNMRSITLYDMIRRVDMWELLVLALKRNLQKQKNERGKLSLMGM